MSLVPLLIQPSSSSERFSFTSLARFAEQASIDKDPSDATNNIYTLREEIIASKYAFTFYLQHMDKLQRRLVARIEEATPDVNDLPEVIARKHRASQAAESLHSSLMTISADILELSNKVARIVKQGVEVEAIKATRFDGVQVLFILQQIPPLLEELFNLSLEAIISEIRQDIIEHVPQEFCEKLFSQSKILNSNPTISSMALDGQTSVLIASFNNKLEQLKVAYSKGGQQDEFLQERQESISSGELSQMIGTLIVATEE